MTAREEILARIGAALSGVDRNVAVPPSPRIAPVDHLVELFVERVEDYRAVVEKCGEDELADRLTALVSGMGTVLVPDGFPVEVPGTVGDTAMAPAELDQLSAVVTSAKVGIAETGTIVLDHGPGQGRRALSLVPDHHLCVVYANQIVADVPDAVERLDARRPQTWISGPSATSDIELNRVEGVHGPRHLHVLVVT